MMKAFYKKTNMANVHIGLLIISLFFLDVVSAEVRYRVKSSDNLNTIIERFYKNSELTKSQLLVGVLAENPRAFKGGNVNFLLRGRRLILPEESDLQQVSPEKAKEMLSEHARFFRHGITGDFPSLILSELAVNQEYTVDSNNILAKQKIQTQKIDQLQQESDDLKKQLEKLINEKSDRDQRLVELEESLKRTLGIVKQSDPIVDSEKKRVLKESNKQLQKNLNITKSELAEHSKSNTALERKVDNLRKILDEGNNEKRITQPDISLISKLVWLLPLLLLVSFLFSYYRKKRKLRVGTDEKIAVSESGYIEPYEGEMVEREVIREEEPLDASIKLDVARAYIEAEDTQSALDILSEIMAEGSDEQRKTAQELLKKISQN